MTNTPTYYQNSPSSGTQYWSHMWAGVVSSGENLSVTVEAWSGSNGGGSLVSVSSIEAILWDQTSNSQRSSFTFNSGYTATTSTSGGTTSGHWYKCSVVYTGGAIGSLAMHLTYSSSTAFVPTTPSFTPARGGPGTSVAITGSRFTDATIVKIGGVNASSFVINSDTSITATVATGTPTGVVTVGNPAGTKNSSSSFIISTLYIRRAGVWIIPTSIKIRRSGVWILILALYIRRSNAWTRIW